MHGRGTRHGTRRGTASRGAGRRLRQVEGLVDRDDAGAAAGWGGRLRELVHLRLRDGHPAVLEQGLLGRVEGRRERRQEPGSSPVANATPCAGRPRRRPAGTMISPHEGVSSRVTSRTRPSSPGATHHRLEPAPSTSTGSASSRPVADGPATSSTPASTARRSAATASAAVRRSARDVGAVSGSRSRRDCGPPAAGGARARRAGPGRSRGAAGSSSQSSPAADPVAARPPLRIGRSGEGRRPPRTASGARATLPWSGRAPRSGARICCQAGAVRCRGCRSRQDERDGVLAVGAHRAAAGGVECAVEHGDGGLVGAVAAAAHWSGGQVPGRSGSRRRGRASAYCRPRATVPAPKCRHQRGVVDVGDPVGEVGHRVRSLALVRPPGP